MEQRIQDVTSQLSRIAEDADERFGELSPEQLNWKPAPASWSVGQCLDHLITAHGLYFPLLRAFAAGPMRPTFWQTYSPFSGLLGRLLIRSMDPKNAKKVSTFPKAEPSTSDIDSRIVEYFCRHQGELIELLRGISPEVQLAKTIITSPLVSGITYSLDDCLTIFVVHGQRHLGQAQRVTETDGFPA